MRAASAWIRAKPAPQELALEYFDAAVMCTGWIKCEIPCLVAADPDQAAQAVLDAPSSHQTPGAELDEDYCEHKD